MFFRFEQIFPTEEKKESLCAIPFFLVDSTRPSCQQNFTRTQMIFNDYNDFKNRVASPKLDSNTKGVECDTATTSTYVIWLCL